MSEPTAIVPDKGIRAGYNGSGADIGAHLFVALEAAATIRGSIELPGAAGGAGYGVTMEPIIDTERGDVQVEGKAIVFAGGVIAVGADVQVDIDGMVLAAATGDIVVGVYLGIAAAADGDLIEIDLAGPAGARISA